MIGGDRRGIDQEDLRRSTDYLPPCRLPAYFNNKTDSPTRSTAVPSTFVHILSLVSAQMLLSGLTVLFLSSCAAALDPHYHDAPVRRARLGSLNKKEPATPRPTGAVACAPFWMENVKHQGVASFNKNSSSTYQVFRNVKDYGAVGDGVTDDTAAIQRAVADGARCAPGVCKSDTRTPAVVYFPGGTYLISKSIIDYYYTQVRFMLRSTLGLC